MNPFEKTQILIGVFQLAIDAFGVIGDFLSTILAAGTAIGIAVLAVHLDRRSKKMDRLDEYAAILGVNLDRLLDSQKATGENILLHYKSSIPEVKRAFKAVLRDVPRANRRKLAGYAYQYCNLDPLEVVNVGRSEFFRGFFRLPLEQAPAERLRAKLISLLECMLALAQRGAH